MLMTQTYMAYFIPAVCKNDKFGGVLRQNGAPLESGARFGIA